MDVDADPCGAETALDAYTEVIEALARQRPPLHNTGALASRSLRERSPGPTRPCRDGTAGASRWTT